MDVLVPPMVHGRSSGDTWKNLEFLFYNRNVKCIIEIGFNVLKCRHKQL